MSDSITIDQIQRVYPHFAEGFRKAEDLFNRINTFDDIETHLLRGAGLSPHTYASYMTAVKSLYNFTECLSPFHVAPGHLNAFYDSLKRTLTPDSAAVRMAGLKRFFGTIAQQMPGYISPFDVMSPGLIKKFSQPSPKDTSQVLSVGEINGLLKWLKGQTEPILILAYRAIFMLVTSGLKARELCGLRWDDITQRDGLWYATGIGRGGKSFYRELYEPALSISRKRKHLFYRLDGQPLDPHALWYAIKKAGTKAMEAAIINKDRQLIFSPNLYRRTYVEILEQPGGNVDSIQERLTSTFDPKCLQGVDR